jgi:hypothetical protein
VHWSHHKDHILMTSQNPNYSPKTHFQISKYHYIVDYWPGISTYEFWGDENT